MKKTIYIWSLLLLPMWCFGQDTLFHWTGDFDWSDSTLVDEAGNFNNQFKIINAGHDTSVYNAYGLLTADKAQLIIPDTMLYYSQDSYDSSFVDTVEITAIFGNINLNNWFYSLKTKVGEKYEAFNEMLILSTPYDLNDEFNIPAFTSVKYVVLDSGSTGSGTKGDPYTSLNKAYTTYASGDTFLILTGSGVEDYGNATYSINSVGRPAKLFGLGNVIVKPLLNRTYLFYGNGNGHEFNNIVFDCDSKVALYTNVFAGAQNGQFKNCYIKNQDAVNYIVGEFRILNGCIELNTTSTGFTRTIGFDSRINCNYIHGENKLNTNVYYTTTDLTVNCNIRLDSNFIYVTEWTGGSYIGGSGSSLNFDVSVNNNYVRHYGNTPNSLGANVGTGTATIEWFIKNNYILSDSLGLQRRYIQLINNANAKVYIDSNTFISTDGQPEVVKVEDLDSAFVRYNTFYQKYGKAITSTSNNSFIEFSYNDVTITEDNPDTTVNMGYPVYMANADSTVQWSFKCHGNKFRTGRYFDPTRIGNHGTIFIIHVDTVDIAYNFIGAGGLGGLIYKNSGRPTYGLGIYNNIFYDGNCLIKGTRDVKVYNNTFINCNKALYVHTDLDDSDTTWQCSGLQFYNNIGYTTDVSDYFIYRLFEQDGDSIYTDNNIFYGGKFARDQWLSQDYTLNTWNAATTNDSSSFATDPKLKSISSEQFWVTTGSDAIGGGMDLGTTYQNGLDKTTIFPTSIVLKAQPVAWYIGAYSDHDTVSTTTNGMNGIRGITGIKGIE